jgi:tRNA A-37 threonylcarbamoyl transferase component Bud32
MGAVFKAWDKDLRRSLALKVALQGSSSTAAAHSTLKLARFVEEAQITGQLDHPGIVPVHEMGVDGEGRVFFTMRLVRGRDLRRIFDLYWNQEEDWTQTRILHVLLKVLEALAFAHTKGVIHRDLKPSNVMVGRFGEVYIMDWGVARILGTKDTRDLRLKSATDTLSAVHSDRHEHADIEPESSVVTMDGEVLGTPAYMPPEQARCETELLSQRSDVYSVGAMLYHLLCGQTPYVPRGARIAPWMVLMRVLEGAPKPILELNPQAAPELVAICEKAMQREAADRYANAEAMKSDLEAFLENRVVAAFETGVVAEVRKWVARNRALAGSLMALVVLVFVGLAGFGYTQRVYAKELKTKNTSLTQATQRAEHQQQVAAQMLELFTGMFLAQDPTQARGRTLTVADVLEKASGELLEDSQLDSEVRSALLISVAQLLYSLDLKQEAAKLYAEAHQLRAESLGETAPPTLEALAHLIGVAGVLRWPQAEELAQLRLRLQRSVHAADATEVVEAECTLATIYVMLGSGDEAERLFEHVIEVQRAHPENQKLIAINAANNLADLWARGGEHERAIEFMTDWVALVERSTGSESLITLCALETLCGIYLRAEYYDEARDALERVSEIRARTEGTDSVDYLLTRARLGQCLLLARQLEQAEDILRRALHDLEAVFSPAHEITDIPRWDLARTLQLRGKQADSETLFRYLLKKYERSYGEGNYSTVSALQRLIETLRDQGQLEEARSLLATLLERDGPSEKYEELRQSLAQSEQR